MSAEQTLYAVLTAGSPANPVVVIVSDRIYPIVVPEGKNVPAIAYQRTQTEYVNTIGSRALASTGSFDVFCVAGEFKEAEDLADAVFDLIDASDVIAITNRSHTFDADSGNYAVVLTVDVDE